MPTREDTPYGYNYGTPVVDYGDAADDRAQILQAWDLANGVEYYTPIPPSIVDGFVILSPDKDAVIHFYDENYTEIRYKFIRQKESATIYPPENARYLRFTFDVTENKDAQALSQKSINNFESFLGGK